MIDPEEKTPAKKPASRATPAKTVITAKDISSLLSLLFSILAASLPDQRVLDFGRNPPEEISLRDLWTIPDDEIALISEPAARMLSRMSNDMQKRVATNWDMITLAIGVIGVIGLRGARHYEIVKALNQPRGNVAGGAPGSAAADAGASAREPGEFWGKFAGGGGAAPAC